MRVFNIILARLSLEKMRLEQRLEEAINSDKPQAEKEEEINEILERLAIESIKIKTWADYIPFDPPEVDNDEEKQENDGTVQ